MISLYARIAAIAALFAALISGAWWLYDQGKETVEFEWTVERLATSENARLREQAAQRTNERIDRDYQTTKSRLAADKRITDDRLRDFAAASADTDSSGQCGADGPYRAIADQCTRSIAILDNYAKGVAGKAAALQDYARSMHMK